MPRLFTAITLPDDVISTLQRVQPEVRPGLRLISREQMHLTMHFLGEYDLELARLALSSIQLPALSLTIDRLGSFRRRKDAILWAGISPTMELAQVHQAMSTSLQVVGYQPEQRPFHPHITLARCDSRVPAAVVKEFENQHWEPVTLPVQEVVLFSSQLLPTGPVYTKEAILELKV